MMDEDEGNIAWEGERSRARPRNSTEALGVENNLKHATEVDHTRLVCSGGSKGVSNTVCSQLPYKYYILRLYARSPRTCST